MQQNLLIDAGPLVAFMDRRDQFHSWAKEILATTQMPLLTCEAVLSETCFLLRQYPRGQDEVMALLQNGLIQIPFRLEEEASTIATLINRYHSVPMSLADACLVRMSEMIPNSTIFTLDSDFEIYRKNQNQVIDVIMPR